MPIASTSSSGVRYSEEVTLGVTAAVALTEMRFTGESVNFSPESIQSAEIRSDRQVPDLVRTRVSAGGDVDMEMSYGAHDDLFAGAFFNNWTTAISLTAQSIDISSSVTNTCRMTDDATASAFTNAVVGTWIRMSGFLNGTNDQYVRVTNKVSNEIVDVMGEANFTDETGQTDIILDSGGMLTLGTTKKSFSIEKYFPDITQFLVTRGCVAQSLELSVATGAIFSGKIGFLGLGQETAATTWGTGSPVAAPLNSVMNSITHIQAIREGGSITTLDVQSLTFSVNNNLRALNSIGSASAFDINAGQAQVTGSMSVYLEDMSLVDKVIDDTASDFGFRATDGAGNTYIIDLPQIRFSSAPTQIAGNDQDVIVQVDFTAVLDPTETQTMYLNRIAA